MRLDTLSILLVSGTVVIICGLVFILNVTLRRNDALGRSWAAAFTAGILCTFGYAVGELNNDAWWALAAANGALVYAVGAIWNGLRLVRGRPPLHVVIAAVSAAVAVAVIARGHDGGSWAGALEMYLALVLFLLLGASEAGRGRLARDLNARALMLGFLAVAGYYIARTGVVVFAGTESALFQQAFGTATSTLVNLSLVVLATVTLSAIQLERFRSTAAERSRGSELGRYTGMLAPGQLRELGAAWIERARQRGSVVVLVVSEIGNLGEINDAFGHASGDTALHEVGDVARRMTPDGTLLGQIDGARLGILGVAPDRKRAEALVHDIRASLLSERPKLREGFRPWSYFGAAISSDRDVAFSALVSGASGGLDLALRGEPGDLVMSPSRTGDDGGQQQVTAAD